MWWSAIMLLLVLIHFFTIPELLQARPALSYNLFLRYLSYSLDVGTWTPAVAVKVGKNMWICVHNTSNTNCAPWCILFITECAQRTSPTQFLPSPTTRHELVCTLPTARCIGYRDVVCPWASVHSPSLAHCMECSPFNPPWHCWPHTFQKTSKHTSLIHYLSFLPIPFL